MTKAYLYTLLIVLVSFLFSITGFMGCSCDDDDDDDNGGQPTDDDDATDDDDDDQTDDDDDDDSMDDDDDDYVDDDDDTSVDCELWHQSVTGSIASHVAMSDTTDESWVGMYLNYERLAYYQTSGNGVPIYEYDVEPESPDEVAVASAEDVSLGLFAVIKAGTEVSVRAFDDLGGASPIWTFTFDAGFTNMGRFGMDVSADGALAIASAYNPTTYEGLLVTMDGATGNEISRILGSIFYGTVELSDDGGRALLGSGEAAVVIDTTTMNELFSFAISGSGGAPRFSRDGTVAAAGGFDCKAYMETTKGWELAWSESESSQWYGSGLAVAGDGSMLFSASRDYSNSLKLTYRVIDLFTGSEIGRSITNGTGGFQDTIARAQASEDGTVFAVASWGLEYNDHPEIQIFDKNAVRIAYMDMPGSPFDLDMTRDGRYVLAGGKAVHANDMGSGGDVYICDMNLAR